MIRIRPLIENQMCGDMVSEHGLSVLFEVATETGEVVRLLTDTGQSGRFAVNAEALGVDLQKVEMLMLSHGHYDHTGGLEALIDKGFEGDVYTGEGVERVRYSVQMGEGERRMKKRNGMPKPELLGRVRQHIISEPTCVVDGRIWIVPMREAAPVNMRLLGADGQADSFSDEVFAVVSDGESVVVYGGCTHHGIANTLRHIQKTLGIGHVDMYVGGLHLMGKDKETIEQAMRETEALDVKVDKWMTCHCTGAEAQQMWAERFKVVNVGETVVGK